MQLTDEELYVWTFEDVKRAHHNLCRFIKAGYPVDEKEWKCFYWLHSMFTTSLNRYFIQEKMSYWDIFILSDELNRRLIQCIPLSRNLVHDEKTIDKMEKETEEVLLSGMSTVVAPVMEARGIKIDS